MPKIATQMPESNAIEMMGDKVYAFLVYEVINDNGLVEYHRIYKHISDDTSLSYDSLMSLVDSASNAYAIELEQE
jgi:hypothetical protein